MRRFPCNAALALAGALACLPARAEPAWHFAVSGDSRNCGDVVMPAIAAAVHNERAEFYWHLGDLRAIYDFDEDFRAQHAAATIAEYLAGAWLDVQRNQIDPFGDLPFFLGIGNHETIPPKTREEFVATFADWLDAPAVRDQRVKDDPHDHQLRTYYHWIQGGVDFITLDNATPDEFDAAQLKWLAAILLKARLDPAVRAVIVGMHEALPESLARGHSMSDFPAAESSGFAVYRQLLDLRKAKPVYVLASHSHFVMAGAFDTPYWQAHGGVLPGWIIGTAGAVRYALPPAAAKAQLARTHVYGYLLGSVSQPGVNDADPVHFDFREVTEASVPAEGARRFGTELLHHCYQDNALN